MPTGFEVLRSLQCDEDLEIVFDHLFEAYRALGDTPNDAFTRAAARVRGIESALEGLGDIPLQGTLVPQVMEGLRHVTKDNAVFYFVTHEQKRRVHVLGVFFSGQDHVQHILRRIAAAGVRSRN